MAGKFGFILLLVLFADAGFATLQHHASTIDAKNARLTVAGSDTALLETATTALKPGKLPDKWAADLRFFLFKFEDGTSTSLETPKWKTKFESIKKGFMKLWGIEGLKASFLNKLNELETAKEGFKFGTLQSIDGEVTLVNSGAKSVSNSFEKIAEDIDFNKMLQSGQFMFVRSAKGCEKGCSCGWWRTQERLIKGLDESLQGRGFIHNVRLDTCPTTADSKVTIGGKPADKETTIKIWRVGVETISAPIVTLVFEPLTIGRPLKGSKVGQSVRPMDADDSSSSSDNSFLQLLSGGTMTMDESLAEIFLCSIFGFLFLIVVFFIGLGLCCTIILCGPGSGMMAFPGRVWDACKRADDYRVARRREQIADEASYYRPPAPAPRRNYNYVPQQHKEPTWFQRASWEAQHKESYERAARRRPDMPQTIHEYTQEKIDARRRSGYYRM